MYLFVIRTFQVFSITTPGLLPSHCIRLWLQPCVPHSPGFWLLEECSEILGKQTFYFTGTPSVLYWTLICALVYWSIIKILAYHILITYQIYFLLAFCFRFYMSTLLSNVQRPINKQQCSRVVMFYRELQLLICFYNKINQDGFILSLLFLIGTGNVMGLLAFIICRDEMNFLQFLVMGSAVFQSFPCLLFGYGALGRIYADSTSALDAFRSISIHGTDAKRTRKIFQKSVKSFQPLKVKLGSVNFIVQLTPATFQNFFNDILVNLLLLK